MEEYRRKLQEELEKYMAMPVSERSLCIITKIAECWKALECLSHDHSLSIDDAREWVSNMQNTDGTVGGHWSVEETSSIKPEGYAEADWYATMNMIYSDYYEVCREYGVNNMEFYAALSRAFIDDVDVHDKVGKYYYHVVR